MSQTYHIYVMYVTFVCNDYMLLMYLWYRYGIGMG